VSAHDGTVFMIKPIPESAVIKAPIGPWAD
jgi:hypothetical protein